MHHICPLRPTSAQAGDTHRNAPRRSATLQRRLPGVQAAPHLEMRLTILRCSPPRLFHICLSFEKDSVFFHNSTCSKPTRRAQSAPPMQQPHAIIFFVKSDVSIANVANLSTTLTAIHLHLPSISFHSHSTRRPCLLGATFRDSGRHRSNQLTSSRRGRAAHAAHYKWHYLVPTLCPPISASPSTQYTFHRHVIHFQVPVRLFIRSSALLRPHRHR